MVDSSLNKQNLKKKLIKEINLKKKTKKQVKVEKESDDSTENEQSDENSEEEEKEETETQVNTYSQEVLCKDNLENEELIQKDPFHIHFEKNLEDNLISKIKQSLNDKQKLNETQQKIKVNFSLNHKMV
jgi:hypothetical protein